MKRKASNDNCTSRKTVNERRRPPSDQSDIGSNCKCGGVSGNVLCKRAVICSKCKKCEFGCRRDVYCKARIPLRIYTNNEIALRKNKRVDYKEKDLSLDDNTEKVYHRNLSLTTATVTDLATAYGLRTFFIPGAQKTLDNLHASKFSDS